MLVMDKKENIEKSAWTGSKHLKGLSVSNPFVALQFRQASTVTFSPVQSTPRNDTESEDLGPDDTNDYYVVLLTWHAQDYRSLDDDPTAANMMPTSSETTITTPVSTNTTVAPPRTAARGTYNRLNAIPTYYG